MKTSEPASTKRRKRSHASPLTAANIADLPSEPLIQIASYLKPPSRALFAVAIAEKPYDESLSRDGIASAIAGDGWATLDFGEIEKDLAAKLSDSDISGVLRCIDAVNTVKKLRLTNCIGITGSGLEPLRNSRTVQIIDLSLVGDHESPVLDPEPPLSCDATLPILRSILQNFCLKFIQFPKVWRQRSAGDYWRHDDFCEFLYRYSDWCRSVYYCCKKCGIEFDELGWVDTTPGEKCGVLTKTCSGCLNNYCDQCYDESGNLMLDFCSSCERYYCLECSKMSLCDGCDKIYCDDCAGFGGCSGSEECYEKQFCKSCQLRCEVCNRTSCADCREVKISLCCYALMTECTTCERISCTECPASLQCDICDITFCIDCNRKEGANGVILCDDCGEDLCIGCRHRTFKKGGSKCTECYEIITEAFNEATKLHHK